MVAERRQTEWQRHQQVRRVGGVHFRIVKQRGRRDVPQQAAEGQKEGDDLCAQHDRRHAADRFGAHPDDKRHAQREAETRQTRRNVQRHL